MIGRIWRWTKSIWARVRTALTPSRAAWKGARNALFLLWLATLVWFTIDEVASPFSVEKAAGELIVFAIFALVSLGLLLLLWLIRLLNPGYRFALFLAAIPLVPLLLEVWGNGFAIALPVFVLGLSLFAGGALSWFSARPPLLSVTTAATLIGAILLGVCLFAVLQPQGDLNPAFAHYHLKGKTLALPDPGKPGPYPVTTFTYGSGNDIRRPEFAKAVRFVTRSVDGSKLDTRWTSFGGWLRTRYWGFDAKHMPLQGRVWMPKGKGPFPLILIVHGNHGMEDYSDPGYAWLGQLLASQGFIFVSVDENFLNSSVADTADPFHLRTGDENKVRGWLLLEHLAQWRTWALPGGPLAGAVDMDRIGLIGHSRGGEAVAHANAFNTLSHFPDDATIPFDFHFHLRAIAAIAPADGQYKPRSRPTPMRDQNYFTIQGSMDGDVTSFMGSSQYERATFSPASNAFKASVYVKGANHGQFNTSWGRNDMGGPLRFLLDERPIMDPADQRRIAAVYLSAFLHTTLKDEAGYRPVFEDARNGAGWLPDVYFANNYADGHTHWLATYEEDLDPATGTDPSVTISAPRVTVWRERYADLKYAPLDTQLALIGWDKREHRDASYVFGFRRPFAAGNDSALVFSASQATFDTLPPDSKVKGPTSADGSLDWTIVVRDTAGHEARLPLSRDQVLYPQIKSETRRAGAIDIGDRSEIVLRRYRFALKDFVAANKALDVSQISEIRFAFDKSPRGAIALDDVGIAGAR